MSKVKVMLIFGGQSPEHEVSIMSAKNIYQALNKEKYEVSLVYITKEGRWFLQNYNWVESGVDVSDENQITLQFGSNDPFVCGAKLARPDIIFPVVHGGNGEDGRLPALFELLNIPYVGCDALSSALCMDKAVSKRLLELEGIQVASFIVVQKGNIPSFHTVLKKLSLPLFVKPANAGSSIGVSRVGNEIEYQEAIKEAFRYDSKILVEQGIDGDEIECAVLGNDNPKASTIGRIIPQQDGLYSYEGKYINDDGAILELPAEYNNETMAQIKDFALKAYNVLGCSGLSRVDMFLTKDGELYLNEVNTIPGFTNISMYPKLWELEGLSQSELMDELIQLGLNKYKSK